MKLLGVLLLCAFAAAVPTAVQKIDIGVEIPAADALRTPESQNILINALIKQLIAYVRYVINNGSVILGIPPLDPFVIDNYHLQIPNDFINVDMVLRNAKVSGIGGFQVHTSNFVPSELSFELDISVPSILIEAEHYDLVGTLLSAFPMYGKGSANFEINNLRIRAKLLLKQSEDGKSVLLDKITDASYESAFIKSDLTGVIGGGDIDKVVNAVIEDVVFDYSNRFQGAIAAMVEIVLPAIANPILEQLDTWKYISIFL